MKRFFALILLVIILFVMTGCSVRLGEDSAMRLKAHATLSATPGINTYLLLGDSIAAHYGVSEKDSYEYKLGELLKQDGERWEGDNWGVSGYTSGDLVTLLTQSMENPARKQILENADLICISIGGNNILAFLREHGMSEFPPASSTGWLGFLRALGEGVEGMAVNYLADLEVIIHLIRNVNPTATILVQNIHNVARDVQGEINILGNTMRATDVVEPVFAPLLRVIRENQEKLGYTLANTYDAFQKSTSPRLLRREMIHPNGDGHTLIAEVLYETYHRAREE